jgi:hypothetical protein
MEVAMLDYRIKPLEKNDITIVVKTLLLETNNKNIRKDIILHMRKEIALKLEYNGEIVGFSLIKEFPTHYSLSYYYIYPKHRKKLCSFFFFAHCLNKMKGKAIFVKQNKNYGMYSRYFNTTVEDGILQFKGLREEQEWAELLKQLKM